MAKDKYECPPTPEELEQMNIESEDHFEFMDREQKNLDSSTAPKLWNNMIAYFKWNKMHPITSKRKIQTGKDAGKTIEMEYTRPLTVKGLCMHCNITEEYIVDVKNSKDKENPFYLAIVKALYIIHTQNVEGAMVGLFEAGFTKTVLNMEKEEAPTSYVKVEHINTNKQLAESENEILEKLDSEILEDE